MTGHHQGNGRALHDGGDIRQVQVFADAGHDEYCHGEAGTGLYG